LGKIGGITLNPEHVGTVNGAWMPTAVFDASTGVSREDLLAAFADEDIDARVFFHPLSSLPMFEAVPTNQVAYDLPRRSINLPSYHDMTNDELFRVVQVISRLSGLGNG
jgi:perosamine synthetase